MPEKGIVGGYAPAMTEMLLFIQEDRGDGRGLCRRDIGDSTVVSPFFLGVVRPSQSTQTQLNLAERDVRWKSNRRLLLGQSLLNDRQYTSTFCVRSPLSHVSSVADVRVCVCSKLQHV